MKLFIGQEEEDVQKKTNFTVEEAIKCVPELANFNTEEVVMGLTDEHEHSEDINLVSKIVYDHLKEFPYYYTIVIPAITAAKKLMSKLGK